MKIIKEGNNPAETRREICKECGCVFEYNRADIHSNQMGCTWVVCPCCKDCIGVEWF